MGNIGLDLSSFNIYPSFRKYQKETIQQVLDLLENSNKKFVLIEAPTGSGKSLIAYIISKYLEKKKKLTFISTSLNMLLDQYSNEFSNKRNLMTLIKGGEHYRCFLSGLSYTEGPCHSAEIGSFSCKDECDYRIALNKAIKSKITLSNLHFFVLEFDFVQKVAHGRFDKRDILICDEAHDIEKVLLGYAKLEINSKIIDKYNKFIDKINEHTDLFYKKCRKSRDIPKKMELDQDLLFKLNRFNDTLKTQYISEYLREYISPKFSEITRFIEKILYSEIDECLKLGINGHELSKRLLEHKFIEGKRIAIFFTHLHCKLSNFLDNQLKTPWCVDLEKDENNKFTGIIIKPIYVNFLAKEIFEKIARKFVFMSATIGSKTQFCKALGLDEDEVEYIILPSTFPKKNRTFVYSPVCKLTYQTSTIALPKISTKVDEILKKHKNDKGIVHTISYYNAQQIFNNSNFKNRLLIHDAKNKLEVFEKFYRSKNKVLVSPSLLEGLDLKDELSRFQIFIKVPFLSLGDKQIRLRMQIDPDWYNYQAILSILQGAGRSIRSEKDFAITYFLDEKFDQLYLTKYSKFFPQYFKEAVIIERN